MAKQKRVGYVFVVATAGGITWIGSSPQPLRAVRSLVAAHHDGPKLSLRLVIEHKNAHALAKKMRTHYTHSGKLCKLRVGWFQLDAADFQTLEGLATYIIKEGPK